MADYENMSRRELMELRANIDRAIAAVGDRDKRNALKAAETAAREHGFSLADLTPLMEGGGRGRGRGRGRGQTVAQTEAAAAARFRNPDDPNQTWSGRGRRPGWYNAALAAGRSPEEMAVG